jgi:F420H(2)-dependent quinone reductase
MSDDREQAPHLPPRWFIRFVWSAHRAVCRISGGRLGLWHPKRSGWGTARLTTTGRRTGQQQPANTRFFNDYVGPVAADDAGS